MISNATTDPTEADRIALTNMFKAIAEFGRKVRLRRQAEFGEVGQENLAEPESDRKRHPPRRKQKRKRKDSAG